MWCQFKGIALFEEPTRFPSLSALTVVNVPLIDPELDEMLAMQFRSSSNQFPALATLRIERMADSAGNQLLSSQWLADFVELLKLDHPLQKVELPGCASETLEQIRRLHLAECVE